VPALATRLSNQGIAVLLLNIFDLTIELLKTEGRWERLIECEPKIPKDQLFKTLSNVSDAEGHLVSLIASKLAASPCRVLLLTGVGLVYPFIRSHITHRTVLVNFDHFKQRFSPRKLIPVNVKTLGDYLLLKRIEADLSQPELAFRSGVTVRRIKAWEHDKVVPSRAEGKVLAAVLKLELQALPVKT
jgi:DNA-binding XRE family transcriptional regulator